MWLVEAMNVKASFHFPFLLFFIIGMTVKGHVKQTHTKGIQFAKFYL